MSIILHPTKGVNPFLTVCERCGKDIGLILVGRRDKIRQCGGCKQHLIGFREMEPCPSCGDRGPHAYVKTLQEGDKLPGGLCDECDKEVREHNEIVRQGGVHWKCKECKRGGVIRPSDFAAKVREAANVPAPNPVGVEFEKCAEHQTSD